MKGLDLFEAFEMFTERVVCSRCHPGAERGDEPRLPEGRPDPPRRDAWARDAGAHVLLRHHPPRPRPQPLLEGRGHGGRHHPLQHPHAAPPRLQGTRGRHRHLARDALLPHRMPTPRRALLLPAGEFSTE